MTSAATFVVLSKVCRYPGCNRRDATCATLAEAEAAIASLVADGWDEDDLSVETNQPP